jgi:Uma2 family endonuclease
MLEPAEAAIAPGRTVTADELFRMPEDGYRYALVRGGLLRMTPAGFDHGAVIMNLAVPLGQHVKTGRLGVVCGAETGFVLERQPDTVLAPDIAFVRRERIPAAGRPGTFWDGPPDLAVEVRSPGDSRKEVAGKVAAWLASGTLAVWVVDPSDASVTIHLPHRTPRRLAESDGLDGAPLLPGFRLPVQEIFAL